MSISMRIESLLRTEMCFGQFAAAVQLEETKAGAVVSYGMRIATTFDQHGGNRCPGGTGTQAQLSGFVDDCMNTLCQHFLVGSFDIGIGSIGKFMIAASVPLRVLGTAALRLVMAAVVGVV